MDARRAARTGTYALLVLAPLAAGTIHRTSVALAGGVAGSVLALAVAGTPGRWRFRREPLEVLLAAAAAACLLQLLPLPPALLDSLQRFRGQVGPVAPGWHPLTGDVPATLFGLTQIATYLALALAIRELAQSDERRRQIVKAVALAATAAAAVACLRLAEPIRDLFLPGKAAAQADLLPLVSTFVNPNHAAACFTLGAIAALALGLSARGQTSWPWLALAAVEAVAVALTLSRGGIGAALLGLATVAVLWRVARARRGRPARGWKLALWGGLLVTVVALTASVVLPEFTRVPLAVEMQQRASKFQSWRECLDLFRGAWPAGIGRDALTVLYHRCDIPSRGIAVPYLENGLLQALLDFGLPIGLALLGLGVWLGVTTVRRALGGDLAALAASGALVALAVHNLVDFNLEAGGVAFLAVALAAAVPPRERAVADARRRSSHRRSGATVWRSRMAATGLAAGTVVLAGVLLLPRYALAEEDDAALAAARQGDTAPETLAAEARAVAARHPFDDYPESTLATATRDRREAVDALERALRLDARSPEAHWAAARLLLAAGHRQQAFLELRAALDDSYQCYALVAPLLDIARSADEVLAGVPRDPELRAIAAVLLRQRGRLPESLALFHRNALDFPADRRGYDGYLGVAMQTGDKAAVRDAIALMKSHFGDAPALAAAGVAEAFAGDLAAARADLEKAHALDPGSRVAAFDLAQFLVDHGEAPRAGTVLDQVGAGSDLSTGELVTLHHLRAAVLRATDRPSEAAYEDAQAAEIAKGQ